MNYMAKKIGISLAVALSLSLSACGGGGSTDVVVSKPGQALYSSAPSILAMNIGDSSLYKIGGGGNGSAFTSYVTSSSNSNVVSVSGKDTDMQITAVSAGSANITVQDSNGGTIQIKVTVEGTGSFKIQSADTVTIKPSTSDTFSLLGGIAPFTVTSSNQGVAKATITGSTLTVNAIGAGGAQIIVFDAKGTSSTIVVSVKDDSVVEAPLFTTAPTFVNLVLDGSTPVFKIGGGKAPYTVTSSAPNVIDIVTTETTFTIKPKKLGFGVVYVTDALGKSVSIQAIVGTGKDAVAFYTSANSSVNVAPSTSTTYELFGGTPPYTITSSNSSVAAVSTSGTKFTINAKEKGTSSVVAKDSLGAVATIAVTVPDTQSNQVVVPLFSTAPGSVVIQPGVTSTFNVTGGVAPYQVSSSNQSVSTASIASGTLSVTGNQVGTSTILVKDSLGTTINIAVTVPSSTSGQVATVLFITAPPAVVVKVGTPETYSVSGGKAPYTATSSDTSVLRASASSDGKVTLTGVVAGNVNVVVVDSNGASVTLAVTSKL